MSEPGGPRTLAVHRATLTEQVYAVLRRDLLQGRLDPGSRLNEKDLAAQLGVSPTPVREALNKLRSEGLVEYRHWQGTVVTDFQTEDLLHLSNVRIYLERLAVRESGQRLAAADLEELVRLHEAYSAAASEAEVGAASVADANEAFHRFFCDRSGNRWLRQMRDSLNGLLILARTPLSARSTGVRSIPEHAEVVKALLIGDLDTAEKAMDSHLTRVRDSLLEQVEASSDR